jgi:uncharacterized RDD family membrane protein YckC
MIEPIESGEDVPSSEAESPERPEARPADRVGPSALVGRPFTRASLGSALLALDTISDRLEQAELEAEAEMPLRRPEDVLIPMSEWGERFGESPDKTARYLMLGIMTDASSKAKKGGSIIHGVSVSMAGLINTLLGPFRRSRTLGPVRRGFENALERGESQVDRWINLGRTEDFSSRRLAQAALNQVADDTMDDMVTNPRIQLFIQEIVQAQSQGMIDEGIEELRERTISGDNFIEHPIRRILRRPPRETVPGPDFDPQLVRAIHKRHLPTRENSLLAYYAGFVSRLLSFALDIAFLTVFLALGSWLLTTVGQLLGFENLITFIRAASPFTFTFGTVSVGLVGALVIFSYILGFWILTGQTLGMMIMGLRVVDKNGGRVGFWRAILRLIGMFVAAIPLYLGFAWIIADNRRQGWQDKIGGTFVVYAWDAQPDETFLRDYLFQHSER